MAQTCSTCSRINPTEAFYCFYDGSALVGRTANGGRIKTGSQPFPHQCVFPSGKVCRDFDQLALACQENWTETRELLQQGFLETFLSGLGRLDLAAVAREAAHNPDHDRGLDQLLDKLPTEVIHKPKLVVEPTEVNLGQLTSRANRLLELHLYNQGMRLLYGSVTSENSVWLALGEAPGAPRKVFQFGRELVIPVQVRGKLLQASSKPQEGRLSIESNGGNMTVVVRVEVPPQPFPEGVLAGALSPRQLAEKAKSQPKQAAAFFETGKVAQWYKDNGWTYPVRGPVATGVGTVQQFFEALGLTSAPKVEISAPTVSLRGKVGERVNYLLHVKTQEKHPVYASAASDQPWLEIGHVKLHGRSATLPLVVPQIPDREGERLQAEVTVTANGNQRFVVPVTLEVGSSFEFGGENLAVVEEENMTAALSEFQSDSLGMENEPIPVIAEKPPTSALSPKKVSPTRLLRLPHLNIRQLVHMIPVSVLGLVLILVMIWDLLSEPTAILRKNGRKRIDEQLLMRAPSIKVNFMEEKRRFGIQMLNEPDPNDLHEPKNLTSNPRGTTNNTCIRIAGADSLFGQPPGIWASEKGKRLDPVEEVKGQGSKSVMDYPEQNIRVTQTVAIFPNERTLKLDTCLVHYLVENRSAQPRKIGVRFMLDITIGANPGVSFQIPGKPDLLETIGDFNIDEIPDSIQAFERPDPKDPGTVAHLGFKLPYFKLNDSDPELDPINRLVICRWKDPYVLWEWAFKPINENPQDKSSCVMIYWPEKSLPAGGKRAMAFTYGLGRVTSTKSGGMELRLDRWLIRPGQDFIVTASVKDPKPDQMIFIHLPASGGFSLVGGQKHGQTVTRKADLGMASWKVRAGEGGSYSLVVTSGLARADQDFEVRSPSGFR